MADEEIRSLRNGWRPEDFVLDPWSGLAHKALVGPGATGSPTQSLAPSWVGMHARRLNAYRVLSAYLSNVARGLLPMNFEDRADHREYGDPATFRDQVVSALLGDEPEYVVDGSDDPPSPVDDLAPEPGPDATESERTRWAQLRTEYEQAIVDYEQGLAEFTAAQDRQEWLDEWIDAEQISQAILETERDVVGLGDGVYVLSWSNDARRPTVTLYDPGFYFPVLSTDRYPNRVHFAWQEIRDGKSWVVRVTYDRRRIAEPRRYPYQTADESPSEWACFMTHAAWKFDDLGDRHVDDFDLARAEIGTNADGEALLDYDLGIDFVPVVHVPNTTSRKTHFGESAITRIAQIFDDVAAADSDLNRASALAGTPPIAVSGQAAPASGKVLTYGPGTAFFTGDGTMTALDTSKNLDALLKYVDQLLDRLSVNGRVPGVILGRVPPSDVPSGFAMLLGFGPFRSLVREMRLVRVEKYALLFKMAQRLAAVGGTIEGPAQRAEVRFGSYLPSDVNGAVTMIVSLLQAHGISRGSALRYLSDAGLPLDDDLAEELSRIEHEDFAGAVSLADATGDEDAAARYLGVVRSDAIQAPAAPAPGPGAPPAPVGTPNPADPNGPNAPGSA